ncbi:hypothetical protein LPJ61_005792, partial [Coemansia biformis]
MARGTRAAVPSLALVLISVVAVLALLRPALGYPSRLIGRSVSAADLSNFRGAILVKNGQTTSCEVALIDNKAAIVAANCLDYDGGSLKAGVTYEIYFDGAMGGAPAKTSVAQSDIIVHPKFSVDTFANNIAILQFSFAAQGSWVNYIAAYRDEWTDVVYVRRTLMAPSTMQWLTPSVQSNTNDDSGCSGASMLYDRNQNTFFCSRIHTTSAFKSTCSLPYGSIYGVASSSMAIAALYSHTVSYGGDACGSGTEYHYYTVLTNYLKYVRSVLGRTPKELVEDTDGLSSVRRIINYFMGSSTAPNADGTTMFGGNLIPRQGGLPPGQMAQQPDSPRKSSQSAMLPTPTGPPDEVDSGTAADSSPLSASTSNTSQSPSPTSSRSASASKHAGAIGNPADADNSYDDSQANGDLLNTAINSKPFASVDFSNGNGTDSGASKEPAKGGLSTKAIVAIAVATPTGTILIAVVAFLLYRLHKNKSPRGGSFKRKSTAHTLIEQIGGARREERLPAYEELHEGNMSQL